MTSPVITISCPKCGATVKDAPYGGRIECRYCGTELHIPDLDGDDGDVEQLREVVVRVADRGVDEERGPEQARTLRDQVIINSTTRAECDLRSV